MTTPQGNDGSKDEKQQYEDEAEESSMGDFIDDGEEEPDESDPDAQEMTRTALDALRNRRGTIGKLSPEGQAQSGLLKTPGLGRGRTKPGRGRVGSTRRAGY